MTEMLTCANEAVEKPIKRSERSKERITATLSIVVLSACSFLFAQYDAWRARYERRVLEFRRWPNSFVNVSDLRQTRHTILPVPNKEKRGTVQYTSVVYTKAPAIICTICQTSLRGSIYAWFPDHVASCVEALNHTEFGSLVWTGCPTFAFCVRCLALAMPGNSVYQT